MLSTERYSQKQKRRKYIPTPSVIIMTKLGHHANLPHFIKVVALSQHTGQPVVFKKLCFPKVSGLKLNYRNQPVSQFNCYL